MATETTPRADDTTAVIMAMQKQVDEAPEPGTFKLKDVIHSGDSSTPMPIVASALESAGYVYVYDRRTGERSTVNRNMLPAQLQKLGYDGKTIFTLERPAHEPVRGHLKCPLHPEARKPEYDAWGLGICQKANLMSPVEVRSHTKTRHPRAWAVLEEERQRKEKENALERERNFQERMLALASGAGQHAQTSAPVTSAPVTSAPVTSAPVTTAHIPDFPPRKRANAGTQ